MIRYLLHGNRPKVDNILPIDIVTRENLGLYSEFNE